MMKHYYTKAEKWIWKRGMRNKSLLERAAVRTARILHAIVMDITEGQLSLRAMSLVYTTLIALAPMLALSFSVLKGFGAHEQIKPALYDTLAPLGDKSTEIADNIIGFVDNIQVGVLGAIGLGLLIYTVVSMMQKIERAFNYAWHVRKERTFAKRFSDYLSVLLVGPLLIFLSVGATTAVKSNAGLTFLEGLPGVGELLRWAGLIVPYFTMGFAFACVYFFMPNTKVNFGSAFVGGLVTAVIWKIMGVVFASFVANSAQHAAVYSAFASLIVFLIWLYVGWLVLLIGSSIAYYHQKNPKSLLVRKDDIALSNRVREVLGLEVMHRICKAFVKGEKPWTQSRLTDDLDMPAKAIGNVLDMLEAEKLVHRAGDNALEYHPNRSLDKLTLKDLMCALRTAQEQQAHVSAKQIDSAKAVEVAYAKVEKAIDASLAKTTLQDWVK